MQPILLLRACAVESIPLFLIVAVFLYLQSRLDQFYLLPRGSRLWVAEAKIPVGVELPLYSSERGYLGLKLRGHGAHSAKYSLIVVVNNLYFPSELVANRMFVSFLPRCSFFGLLQVHRFSLLGWGVAVLVSEDGCF